MNRVICPCARTLPAVQRPREPEALPRAGRVCAACGRFHEASSPTLTNLRAQAPRAPQARAALAAGLREATPNGRYGLSMR